VRARSLSTRDLYRDSVKRGGEAATIARRMTGPRSARPAASRWASASTDRRPASSASNADAPTRRDPGVEPAPRSSLPTTSTAPPLLAGAPRHHARGTAGGTGRGLADRAPRRGSRAPPARQRPRRPLLSPLPAGRRPAGSTPAGGQTRRRGRAPQGALGNLQRHPSPVRAPVPRCLGIGLGSIPARKVSATATSNRPTPGARTPTLD
jgi:hypothetical protein